ncbi:MAG: ABC transporter ATP-binding protein [Candidatus Lokiarchaeota archaeon]|nr:ABC transporter ATP-binding protein [Candidatus Lokiarchaeota archaeon]
MPKIELLHVSKTFDEGKVVANDDVTLSIEDGAFVFLLGPSGCGKTTLLKLISGLETPTSGTILVGGIDLSKLNPEERSIGFVFQHFEIFPAMTVFENVAYGLVVRGYDDETIEKIAEEALRLVSLEGRMLAYPKELSTPELQKVGLARAIATRSKILFLDEPLGKLDPKIRKVFRHELRRLIKSLGLTAIQVTHDQEEAMAIGDQIIVMRQGKILQHGKPEDLYYRPGSIFVANFFGETNFLEGFVSGVGPDSCVFHLHLGGPKFEIKLQHGHQLKNHVQAIIGYRIEDVELIQTKQEEREPGEELDLEEKPRLNTVKGRVREAIFIGPMKRFIIDLENGDEIQAKHSSKFLIDIREGDEILVGFHENPMVFEYPKDIRAELSKA